MSIDSIDLPLSGVRILDLTQVLSGPFCTQLLGDMGADVIKVEGPEGDVARSLMPQYVGDDSVYYLSINRNKRSIVIDLKTKQGVELLRRLALSCDIVIENFRPGVCERLGFSSTDLRGQKPSLIWCSISGFGQSGPYRNKPAYDIIVQALSGGMSLTGARDGFAVRAGLPIADLSAGLYASSAILASLYRREKTGRGDLIDISMLDCQVAMLCYQAASHLHSGRVPGRQGREHDGIATYGTFFTRDSNEVVIAAVTERMWVDLCDVLGCNELVSDARFVRGDTRLENRAALIALLMERFLTRTADEWMAMLDSKGIPAGIVNTLDRVVADPQVRHRNLVVEMCGDKGRKARVIGNPVLFEEAEKVTTRYPPAAGENSVEVLKELLGLTDGEVSAAVKSGAVSANTK
jgi:crotonobetainyl-CoA:carnitine CoA-transferase CaiB-like acyl-CoA transferase